MPKMKFTDINPSSPEPMPPGGILRSTFRVGYRFRCTMTMDVSGLAVGPAIGALNAQWEPSLPKRLSANELRDYRAGRDAFFQRAASREGRFDERSGESGLQPVGRLTGKASAPLTPRRLATPIRPARTTNPSGKDCTGRPTVAQ
jgi:hypothetical protein